MLVHRRRVTDDRIQVRLNAFQRRDKLGFATPEQRWFRGPLKAMIVEGIEATLKRYPELFNAAGVRALRDDMLEGRRTVDFTLWRIANMSLWGERFGVTV